MVAQGKESTKAVRLQAGSSEADNGFLSDVDVRVTRSIGQQLAAIGDQFNQHLAEAHLPVWVPEDVGNLLARGALYWASLGLRWQLNAVTRAIRRWLTYLVCRQTAQTEMEAWREQGPIHPDGPNWLTGRVAVALLLMAVTWNYF